MGWTEVERNASSQEQRARDLAASAATASRPPDIEAFYPELHQEPVNGAFSNTMGSLLLPDVLTSPRVLVDLYDWEDPTGLIKTYGVDLDFLVKLRDKGHVILCANLEPERYQRRSWLHDLVADPRTIFRSVRSPYYFEAHQPGFVTARQELKARILQHLSGRPEREVEELCKMANAAYAPTAAEDLANTLSLWGMRVRVTASEFADEILRRLPEKPEEVVLDLRQLHLLAATPISAGLGGYVRLDEEKLQSYFPDPVPAELLAHDELTRLQQLNEFLTRLVFDVSPVDLNSEAYWQRLPERDKEKILEILENRRDREEALHAEAVLRRHIVERGHKDWSEKEIKEYAHRLVSRVDLLGPAADLGVMLTAFGFLWARGAGEAGSTGGAVVVFLLRRLLGNKLIGAPVRRLVEFAIPKIRVARFIRRHHRR